MIQLINKNITISCIIKNDYCHMAVSIILSWRGIGGGLFDYYIIIVPTRIILLSISGFQTILRVTNIIYSLIHVIWEGNYCEWTCCGDCSLAEWMFLDENGGFIKLLTRVFHIFFFLKGSSHGISAGVGFMMIDWIPYSVEIVFHFVFYQRHELNNWHIYNLCVCLSICWLYLFNNAYSIHYHKTNSCEFSLRRSFQQKTKLGGKL